MALGSFAAILCLSNRLSCELEIRSKSASNILKIKYIIIVKPSSK
jgi:hypothetical protein